MRRLSHILMLVAAAGLASCTSFTANETTPPETTTSTPAPATSDAVVMEGPGMAPEYPSDVAQPPSVPMESGAGAPVPHETVFGADTRKNLSGGPSGQDLSDNAPDEFLGTEPVPSTMEEVPADGSVAQAPEAVSAAPENSQRLTVRDAVDLALKQNLRLMQQWEAIGEAEARLREKQNEYGPRLQFDYTIWTWHGIFVDPVVSDPDIPVEGTGRAEMTLFLPVWVARQSRDAAMKQALEEVKVRKADYALKRSQIAAEVVKKYFDVLAADEALMQSRVAVGLNEERMKTLRTLEREGKVLKNKVLLGEKFLASAKEEVTFRQSERDVAALRLRRLVRVPDCQAITLARPVGMTPEPPTEAAAVARTQADNPLLKRLEHEKLSAYWTGRVRGYEEPRAHLALRYGASFPEYERFTDDFATVGLTVNWPTGKCRLDRAKRDQARHKVNQLEIEKQIIGEELDLNVREAHAAYMKSLQRVEAKEIAVALAEENLRLSQIYRKEGQTDTQEPEDVFQVTVNAIALAEARSDLMKVRYETYSLMADLFQKMFAVDDLVDTLSRP